MFKRYNGSILLLLTLFRLVFAGLPDCKMNYVPPSPPGFTYDLYPEIYYTRPLYFDGLSPLRIMFRPNVLGIPIYEGTATGLQFYLTGNFPGATIINGTVYDNSITVSNFSMTADAWLRVDQSGYYTFIILSDFSAVMTINNDTSRLCSTQPFADGFNDTFFISSSNAAPTKQHSTGTVYLYAGIPYELGLTFAHPVGLPYLQLSLIDPNGQYHSDISYLLTQLDVSDGALLKPTLLYDLVNVTSTIEWGGDSTTLLSVTSTATTGPDNSLTVTSIYYIGTPLLNVTSTISSIIPTSISTESLSTVLVSTSMISNSTIMTNTTQLSTILSVNFTEYTDEKTHESSRSANESSSASLTVFVYSSSLFDVETGSDNSSSFQTPIMTSEVPSTASPIQGVSFGNSSFASEVTSSNNVTSKNKLLTSESLLRSSQNSIIESEPIKVTSSSELAQQITIIESKVSDNHFSRSSSEYLDINDSTGVTTITSMIATSDKRSNVISVSQSIPNDIILTTKTISAEIYTVIIAECSSCLNSQRTITLAVSTTNSNVCIDQSFLTNYGKQSVSSTVVKPRFSNADIVSAIPVDGVEPASKVSIISSHHIRPSSISVAVVAVNNAPFLANNSFMGVLVFVISFTLFSF
ncbi:hypothetical protein, no similarity [Maudiozyma barnettii]|uniref:PA14 domain-containing protein n=1 Tax=Maudiozyma barnettii TaxID=61262 RepID=A0A8H2ZK62_9SACH|nr:hypothetical protein, no similarity [Kazachstania barnettii]CAB4257237.1 hypothetical protein, no similarity [Kazachstania barnettii]CAD1779607.1 hypothetical protein, no similarity [Kazachstania barnettii]